MGIVHIVLFEFKPEVGHEAVQDVGCIPPTVFSSSTHPVIHSNSITRSSMAKT